MTGDNGAPAPPPQAALRPGARHRRHDPVHPRLGRANRASPKSARQQETGRNVRPEARRGTGQADNAAAQNPVGKKGGLPPFPCAGPVSGPASPAPQICLCAAISGARQHTGNGARQMLSGSSGCGGNKGGVRAGGPRANIDQPICRLILITSLAHDPKGSTSPWSKAKSGMAGPARALQRRHSRPSQPPPSSNWIPRDPAGWQALQVNPAEQLRAWPSSLQKYPGGPGAAPSVRTTLPFKKMPGLTSPASTVPPPPDIPPMGRGAGPPALWAGCPG